MAAAFEDMGVTPELIRAVEQKGWSLPTPVQADAVPLILGGGDVMAAAETGSGKTGAFALPILQVVHEALTEKVRADRAASGQGAAASAGPPRMSEDDRDPLLSIDPAGLLCQSRAAKAWAGARATVGVVRGCHYWEATVRDEGLVRVGWSTRAATLELGTDKQGFGFGGSGIKSHNRQFEPYGEPFGKDDVVGCFLDCDQGVVSWSKNGNLIGPAFELPKNLVGQAFFPAVCLKNAEVGVNFGGQPLKHASSLPPNFKPLASAPPAQLSVAAAAPGAGGGGKGAGGSGGGGGGSGGRTPMALVLEPTKDLAEQTHETFVWMSEHLASPKLQPLLLIGGDRDASAAKQARALQGDVDVVTGTPLRVLDFVETGKLDLSRVRFFVLDEADRLLDTGNKAPIMKLFERFRKSGTGTHRLQVLMFSATLHSPDILELSGRICENPIWVDLKGKDSVPEGVRHAYVLVDPEARPDWAQLQPAAPTDRCHALDKHGNSLATDEAKSEAVKRLKPHVLKEIIDTFKMDQALIFCRTNFDCDNLEAFLTAVGGGRGFRGALEKGKENPYSCCVLGGQRTMEERRKNLEAFKNGDVRFLICTDVAARGIDIKELPYIVNVTLPDRPEDYIHRIGRVGRAGAMGLAISLVARSQSRAILVPAPASPCLSSAVGLTLPTLAPTLGQSAVNERVWFCDKGLKPWLQPQPRDVLLRDQGGQTIWYDEPALFQDIEKRLGHKVAPLGKDYSTPADWAAARAGEGGDDAVVYGKRAGGTMNAEAAARQEWLAPKVAKLAELEHSTQSMFWAIKQQFAPGAR